MVSDATRIAACLAAILMVAEGARAAPSDDRILPLAKYTSEKARQLATAHGKALGELNAVVYNCMPWVDVQRESIGFFRPKHIEADERYLSIRIYIEQDPSPQFQALKVGERASAMFSRYVGPMLRRMAHNAALAADRNVDGFTVILGWQKQGAKAASGNPIHETIAVFLPRPVAVDYLTARIKIAELAHRAKVLGFDGETALGELKVSGWDDNFVSTYKVANYKPDPEVTCQ